MSRFDEIETSVLFIYMFVNKVRFIDNRIVFFHNIALMNKQVYLLMFNSETLFASMNITVLHHALCVRCLADKIKTPDIYHTVRRRILADGKYIHEPRPGWKYQIIERQLIKKTIQYKIAIGEETALKHTADGEPPRQG